MPDLKGHLRGRCRCEKEMEYSNVFDHQRLLVHSREKEADSVIWKSAVHSRSETVLFKQCPVVRGESLHKDSLPMGGLPAGSRLMARWRADNEGVSSWSCSGWAADGDKVFPQRDSEWVAREPFHSETASRWQGTHLPARQWADGKGAIPQQDSKQMVRQPSQSKTASIWRGSHLPARQRADGEGANPQQDSEWMVREPSHGETVSGQWIMRESSHSDTGSVQRIVWILGLTSDRACSGAVKPWVNHWADERWDLQWWATECVVCGPET